MFIVLGMYNFAFKVAKALFRSIKPAASLCYCKPKLMIYSHTLPFMSEKLLLFFICIASHVAFGCCNSYTYDVLWYLMKEKNLLNALVLLLNYMIWREKFEVALFCAQFFKIFLVSMSTKSNLKLLNCTQLSKFFIASYLLHRFLDQKKTC